MLLKILYFIQVMSLIINITNTVLFFLISEKFNDIGIMLLLYIIFEYLNIGLLQLSVLKKKFNSAINILYSKVISIFIGILILYRGKNICDNSDNSNNSDNKKFCILLNIISFNIIVIITSIFLGFYYKRRIIRRENQNENLLFVRVIPYTQTQNIIPIHNNMIDYQYPTNIINNVNADDNSTIICSICLEEKQSLEEWNNLKCNHQYHKKCIGEWLKKTDTCPDCRTIIK
jgi:hypothetical protein